MVQNQTRGVLVVAVVASVAGFLDGSIANVVVPAITAELGGGLAGQQWVVSSYLVTLGSFMLIAGAVSDRIGHLRAVRIGVTVFAALSLAVAASPTIEVLIITRAALGIAGALLVPASLALISDNYTGAARARAVGAWTGWTSVAFLLGPTMGGLFVGLGSWRYAFAINVIPAIIVLTMTRRSETSAPPAQHGLQTDIPGAVLCALGLGGVVTGLIVQEDSSWAQPIVWAPVTAGAGLLAAFILRQRAAKNPILPLTLFRSRNFTGTNLTTFFLYAAIGAFSLLASVFLQERLQIPAVWAGSTLIPSSAILAFGSAPAGAIANRTGPRVVMTVGPLLAVAGVLLTLTVSEPLQYFTQLLPGALLYGAGLTLTISPLTSTLLSSVSADRSGTASAANNAIARIAGLLSVAILGTVVGGHWNFAAWHRGVIFNASLLLAAAISAFILVRAPRRAEDAESNSEPATETHA
jgi:EmrB/QacA subfamily drug resistance transporter